MKKDTIVEFAEQMNTFMGQTVQAFGIVDNQLSKTEHSLVRPSQRHGQVGRHSVCQLRREHHKTTHRRVAKAR